MSPLLKKLMMARYMAAAGDEGADTGGTDVLDNKEDGADEGNEPEDRGDLVTKNDGQQENGHGTTDEEEDEGGQRFQGIPKARFNEVNERRKALETENEELRQQLAEAKKGAPAPAATPAPAPAAEFDAEAKEQEYATALIEGDTAKATKIRREINAHLISEAEARADAMVRARTQHQLLQDEVAATLRDHPWLNDAEGADALDLIIAKRDAEIAKGKAPHLALRDAVAKIVPRFAPAGSGSPQKGLASDTEGKDTRAVRANERGAADSLKQPAPIGGAGVGGRASGGQPDVESMTDEQFAELSESDKKRLRGD